VKQIWISFVNQIWISSLSKFGFSIQNVFVPNCVANACPKALVCHVHIVHNIFAHCQWTKQLMPKIQFVPRTPEKIWLLDKASLYIIPISSQQRSQPRGAGFARKTFQISVPTSVRFLQDFSQNLPLLMSGISLGKKMGKNSSSCMWLPSQLGPHNTCPLCYIWSQVCNETWHNATWRDVKRDDQKCGKRWDENAT